MLVIRSLLFYLGLALFTIPFTLLTTTLGWLLPFSLRRRVLGWWSIFALFWLKVTCQLNYRVIGRENIPTVQSAIILAKHQSAWETIAMQQILPTQTWVLKRELLWLPFFGWGLAMTRPVAINRTEGKKALKQVLEQGAQRLQQGIWLVVFPEGTRTAYGSRESRYAIGGAMLAAKTGTTVVPVAHNAGQFWPKDSFIKKPGTITLSIGPPIVADQKAAAINQQAQEWIEAECLRIG
ncbi:1-acyl-sn-glycerol-3-phosphate acyltransferase [Ectothiorhodospiraceae bacterium BW-2]|nr:1-acyl-sn-glycerol-3-phosphate acyltransferase [Ectothiorhodospiraceae bacterium BW-2]